MVKHICICDRCGKEEDLKARYCVAEDPEQPVVYSLPNGWEYFGVMPKYQLCGKCSAELKCKIEDLIYRFVENKG